MRVAELKKTIGGYRTEQLRRLLVEMYKAMPKRVKEDHGIDDIICSPASKRNNRKSEVVPDIEALAFETERFVGNAYNYYYCIPNPVVPKRERSKWRFTVLRLFKNINHAASGEAKVAFLDTPDLKEIAITTCEQMWSRTSTDDASARSVSKSYEDRCTEYQRSEFLQNLARLGFLCHMALCEYEEAVEYFHKHYVG